MTTVYKDKRRCPSCKKITEHLIISKVAHADTECYKCGYKGWVNEMDGEKKVMLLQ